MKPKLFIGSSVESLDIAYAIQQNLEHDCDPTVWSQGVFQPSITNLDSLLEVLEQTDFGAFVFSPDDILKIRNTEHSAIRDNVLFELGLFIGKLGKERNFIVQPQNAEHFRLATDLIGVSPVTFNADRPEIAAALGPGCHQIRTVMRSLGPIQPQTEIVTSESQGENPAEETMVFKNNAYWKVNVRLQTMLEGPFCSKCQDVDSKLVRMIKCPNPDYSQCPACKHPLRVSFDGPPPPSREIPTSIRQPTYRSRRKW